MQPNQPNQNQPIAAPPTPVPPVPAQPQFQNNIQAASQQNLQPKTVSITSANVNAIPPIPAGQRPAPQPMAAPIQSPPMPARPGQPMSPPTRQPMPTGPQPIQPQTRGPSPAESKKLTKEQQERLDSAQNSLLISEIRENMVILNDGSFRAVIACESINYDLMSSEERDGIEFQYQGLLDTLNFPIQILVQSRRIDIKPYLEKLEAIRAKQENMLLGVMMDDYLDFIFDISQQANIMRKDFFVVIPYTIGGDASSDVNNIKNMTDSLVSTVEKKQRIKIDAKSYDTAKDEIKNRVTMVLSGLMNIGVRAGQLPTKALSELYYNFYNPDTALNEPIIDIAAHSGALYIKKGEGEAPSNIEGVG
jgi:hypothetical protein